MYLRRGAQENAKEASMSKDRIVEMNDFEYTAEWFEKLKTTNLYISPSIG
jgi:hypothetical protein